MKRIVNTFLGRLNLGKSAYAVFVQTFTTLFGFGYMPGANSYSALVQGTDGKLYGTTAGADHGTIFNIAPSGTLTT